MKIGVIDSGIGGLTVLKRLMQSYPRHEYIYFGDNIHLPYGEKTPREIIGYAQKIIRFLEQEGVDRIVLACGTMSSYLNLINSNVPLIDMLSPINKKLDHYYKVAIMATPLSIQKNAFANFIHTNLKLIACPNLATLIEQKDTKNCEKLLEKLLKDVDSEVLLLACTHYPLVKNLIQKYYPNKIVSLDEYVIDKLNDFQEDHFSLKIYYSLLNEQVIQNTYEILQLDNILIERSDIDDGK